MKTDNWRKSFHEKAGEGRSALWVDLLRLHSHGCFWCLTCLTKSFHVAHIVLCDRDGKLLSLSNRWLLQAVSFFNPMANPRRVRLLGIIKYLAVPNGLGSCCEYLIFLR